MATAKKAAAKKAPSKKAAAKKAPAKKAAAKKAPAKKAPYSGVPWGTSKAPAVKFVVKTSKKPLAVFTKVKRVPNKALAEIIGSAPVEPSELRRRLWEYVKAENLEQVGGAYMKVSLNAPLKKFVKKEKGGGDRGKGDDPGPSVTWSELARLAVKAVK
jgi:chromatin remodeling complex protein RSC6